MTPRDVLAVAGYLLIVAGVLLLSVPLGLIVAGALLLLPLSLPALLTLLRAPAHPAPALLPDPAAPPEGRRR